MERNTWAPEGMNATRFSGSDERGAVTLTVDASGRVVEVSISAERLRKLPVAVFESSIRQAFTAARATANAEGASVLADLRDRGIDLQSVRRIFP